MDLSPFENNVFLLLFFAAVIHGFYVVLLLLIKSRKERGLAFLGLMMIPVSLWVLTYLLYIADLMRPHPHLLGVFVPSFYLLGACYYFFIRRSLDRQHRFRWYDLAHLLPVLYVLWEWMPVYSWSVDVKRTFIEKAYTIIQPEWTQLILAQRHSLLFLAYVLFSFYLLQRCRKATGLHAPRVRWLWRFSAILTGIIVLKLLLPLLFWGLAWDAAAFELTTVLLMAIAIHALGYVVLGKDQVLPAWLQNTQNGKYATSPLDADQIAAHQKNILQYFEAERPWLSADFSIGQLAEVLHIPRHHLSQTFSEGLQMSFYDLVNRYRIAAVKQRLRAGDAETYSIQGIADDCGFGSKSSFNRAFKKEVGVPPSEWLRTHQQDQSAKLY